MNQSPSAVGPESSRRDLLGRGAAGLAAGAALLAAGCGSRVRPTGSEQISDRQRDRDVEILQGLLRIEQQAIAGYTAGLPLLPQTLHASAQDFLNQELAHAGELDALIKRHKAKPVKPAQRFDLGSPRSPDDVLELFDLLERRQIAAYRQAIPLVAPGEVRAALGAVLGSDAQHLAIVRTWRGRPALTSPFVTGNEAE